MKKKNGDICKGANTLRPKKGRRDRKIKEKISKSRNKEEMVHQKNNETNFIFRGRTVPVDECQEVRNPALVPPMESCGTVDETHHLSFHFCKMGTVSTA